MLEAPELSSEEIAVRAEIDALAQRIRMHVGNIGEPWLGAPHRTTLAPSSCPV